VQSQNSSEQEPREQGNVCGYSYKVSTGVVGTSEFIKRQQLQGYNAPGRKQIIKECNCNRVEGQYSTMGGKAIVKLAKV
jgi:hypothetical protein